MEAQHWFQGVLQLAYDPLDNVCIRVLSINCIPTERPPWVTK